MASMHHEELETKTSHHLLFHPGQVSQVMVTSLTATIRLQGCPWFPGLFGKQAEGDLNPSVLARSLLFYYRNETAIHERFGISTDGLRSMDGLFK